MRSCEDLISCFLRRALLSRGINHDLVSRCTILVLQADCSPSRFQAPMVTVVPRVQWLFR